LKVVELIYGKQAYDKMDTMYQRRFEHDVDHLNKLAEEKEYWREQLEKEKAHQKLLKQGSNVWQESQERIKEFE